MRHEYRITKYNPRFRGVDGSFRSDEWTAFSDIGRKFAGRTLTKAEYERVEGLYLDAIETFMKEAAVATLSIRNLETQRLTSAAAKIWKAKRLLRAQDLRRFATMALRNQVWARLEAPRRAFVHFGYDYYMYIGTGRDTSKAAESVEAAGLYVERVRSPYKRAA